MHNCRLPPLYSHECRAYDGPRIVKLLCKGHPVCLTGQVGLGKSTAALDVGWQMVAQGLVPSGADIVDLRDAYTEGRMDACFRVALAIGDSTTVR